MIMRGFKSVLWVGAVGGAALSCYMVSLRVATERADLARVERQIVAAKRDIRTLHTELDTRGRLSQLEDWNTNVLALSAPSSSQYVKNGTALAQLATREQTVGDRAGDVRLASAETGAAAAPAQAAPAARPEATRPAAPETATLPRVVEAVATAPAPHRAGPVRSASFEIPESSPETLPETPLARKAGPAKAHAAAADGDRAEAAPGPARKARVAKADPVPARKARPAAIAEAAPARSRRMRVAATDDAVPTRARKMRTEAKGDGAAPAGRGARGATRAARADARGPARPAKPHPARLARADGAPRPPASGHRGGAQ
ncbi:MAG TPA: hypothetical protein VFW19_04010 [Allosphingosinicella sp.]|nr:hypothetical protein [Allosphingosinicella sp.]